MILLIERVARRAVPAAGDDFSLLLRHGGDNPVDTDQAFVLSPRGEPLALVKVARGPRGHAILQAEQAKLLRIARASPSLAATLPRPLLLEQHGERTLLVESYLRGRRLKDLPPAVIAGRPERIDRIADWLIELTTACPPEPPPDRSTVEADVERTLTAYRQAFVTGDAEAALLDGLAARLAEAGALTAVISHGDFTDANILVDGDRIAVIDWTEERPWILPGADLFYFLLSLQATRRGLARRDRFEQALAETFFAESEASARSRRCWQRYRAALGLREEAAFPLFAFAQVHFALHKLAYIEEGRGAAGSGTGRVRGITEPQRDYPLSFFADGACLNVALAAALHESFVL